VKCKYLLNRLDIIRFKAVNVESSGKEATMIKTHQLLKCLTVLVIALALLCGLGINFAQAFYQSPEIPLFGTQLRSIVGAGNIPVALPDPFAAPVTGVTHYTINIKQFQDQIVPGLGPTILWGYDPAIKLFPGPQRHLGGIIVGNKGVPIQITFTNQLPTSNNSWGQIHPLPVDVTIPGAILGQNRAAIHLHGGHVPWISDGGPFDWFSPTGVHGSSFLNNVLNPAAFPNQAEYYYPLDQSARFVWYHDHAVGITRLNAYAGIATAFILRDDFEKGLVTNQGLPDYIENGGFELPIVVQDKIFVHSGIGADDPTWTGANTPGSLWYAHTYEVNQSDGTGRWDQGPTLTGPLPDPSAIPEFFGDTMLVNGTTFPQTDVQARRYRLRILNACNARFLNLQLYIADDSANSITLDKKGHPANKPFVNVATGGMSFLQIGTEGGFLPKPTIVPSNQPMTFVNTAIDPVTGQTDPSKIHASLLMAPAERTDVIVDFSGAKPGTQVILYTDAPAPFPSGDDRNDYFPGFNCGNGLFGIGNPVNCNTTAGFGPNTRVLMRFNVVAASDPGDLKLKINPGTDLTSGNDPLFVAPGSIKVPAGISTRFLTLNEYFDEFGRLIQILGDSNAPFGSPYFGTASYSVTPPGQNVGETRQEVSNGATEVWEIYNTTGDVHPMHFHLVNVQIINRQLFDMTTFPGTINFTGPAISPDKNEQGWKETVRMYPGTVTRIIQKFDVPLIRDANGDPVNAGTIVNGAAPPSPRTGGNEYVWHCHILEHEEHDMMHALVVH
jgi:spore coat protein A